MEFKANPMDRLAYGEVFITALVLQLLALSPCLAFYTYGDREGRIDLQLAALGTLFVVMLILKKYFGPRIDIRHRLAHLYPGEPLPGRVLLGFLTLIPLISIPVYLFLLIAQPAKNASSMPFFFRHWRTSALFCFCVLSSGPAISAYAHYRLHISVDMPKLEREVFWSTTPLTYYSGTVSAEARSIISERDYIQNSVNQAQTPVSIRAQTRENVRSVAGSVLLELVAESARRRPAENRRDIASDLGAEESSGHHERSQFAIFENSIKALEGGDHRGFEFARFNPVHFLFSNTIMEISLAVAADQVLNLMFYQRVIIPLEAQLELAKTNQPEHLVELNVLLERLHAVRDYKSYMRSRQTWLGRLKI